MMHLLGIGPSLEGINWICSEWGVMQQDQIEGAVVGSSLGFFVPCFGVTLLYYNHFHFPLSKDGNCKWPLYGLSSSSLY